MTQAHERSATLSELVAEEIRALLARRRKSGRWLAAELGVSPSWVSYRLTGTQPIDLNDMHLIAGALEVGVHDLLPPPDVAARAAGGRLNSHSSRLARAARRHVTRTTPSHPAVASRRDSSRPTTQVDPGRRRPVSVRPPNRPIAA